MIKLFLTSYFACVSKLFANFTENTCLNKKVVFIPTASIVEEVNYYVDTDKKELEKLGLVLDELEISKAPKNKIEQKILEADYIFMEGGNTFFLLQELKRTGTDELIKEHIRKGKIYIGCSAGSMIVSKTIKYEKYMYEPDDLNMAPGLKNDFTALSVVDFSIVPHYNSHNKIAKEIIRLYSKKYNLRPICDNQVITVVGNEIEVLTVK
ncbi:Type 1 glutamine amidotransferase-like domain-containing protein [Breznakiella homolactica]|uniref:Type 1 glutamine amidotransferase-like domain-containing protein n=1 Tax=Breznakiella homolactica TaxID=2798577 RepID=A0A7T8BBB4_9SPIR|nr:Type 1 glutamine amidotransferase-like domain-containing protein [Breznakiella homolactica]QQO10382.1 peptidase E [Breznakiella homolactica]